MILLFPADPLNTRQVDPFYEAEMQAAETANITCAVISFETLLVNPQQAVRSVPSGDSLAVYRGWMMTVEQYEGFYNALALRAIQLINDPAMYRHTHHLPESYPLIAKQSAKTVWLNAQSTLDEIMEALRIFGTSPVILKDYVKSQKHYWNEACYIPSAADEVAVERVVGRFLDLQGSDLVGGLVFREYLAFEPLPTQSQKGLPLTKEFRLFWLDGTCLYATEYWDDADYGGSAVPAEIFNLIAQTIQSRFFTMDVAVQLDGQWLIVELGDAQVSGLPEHADLTAFYNSLQRKLTR